VGELFRKKINLQESTYKIERNNFTLLIGSCFSENIGEKLVDHRFNCAINPHGVLFNPISIADVLNLITGKTSYESYFYNQIWHSWQHNSTFSHPDKATFNSRIDLEIERVRNDLHLPTTVILTFGTAWAYRLKSSGKIVANCHKIPQNQFDKILLTPQECIPILKEAMTNWSPSTQWILTISPVRHWKDGVRENNLSKGILHQMVDELLKLSNTHYFPAYELVIDELRDYRFYENDMLHPNKLAIDYVWQQFEATFFTKETRQVNAEISQLNAGFKHRPLHPESSEYLQFLTQLNHKKQELTKNHGITWD
jgi:hypothetical protein